MVDGRLELLDAAGAAGQVVAALAPAPAGGRLPTGAGDGLVGGPGGPPPGHPGGAPRARGGGGPTAPRRHDAAKTHPGLVPYHALSESEKAYDRDTALGTLQALVALGYRVVPAA